MGSRVTRTGSVMKVSEEVADRGKGDNGDPGGPGQSGEISLLDSDSIGSIRSDEEHAPAASERDGAQGLASSKGGGRILMVDDEQNIADTLLLIFQMRRYDVRVAYSAEGAIELIAEWCPDLAVLDVI